MSKGKLIPENESGEPVKVYTEKPDPQAETGVQGDAYRTPDAETLKEAEEKLHEEEEKAKQEVIEKNDTSGAAS